MPDSEQKQAEKLYAELKPAAVNAYTDSLLSQTPPALQDEMRTIAAADLTGGGGPPLTGSQVILNNGDQVAVISDGGFPAPGEPGTASVINGTLQGVQLQPIAGARGGRQPGRR